MSADFLFQIAILIMSVVIHEVAHGYAARALGDHTAEYEGRLTLNPLKHLDPFGSVILPLILAITNTGFIIGWAKPVPYNPYNLRPGRWSEALVAAAGPASNLAIALVFGLILRFGSLSLNLAFFQILSGIVLVNIVLMVFNLVPIAPLDGSKLLFAIFPQKFPQLRAFFERYGFALLLFFIFFLWQYLLPIVLFIFSSITGLSV